MATTSIGVHQPKDCEIEAKVTTWDVEAEQLTYDSICISIDGTDVTFFVRDTADFLTAIQEAYESRKVSK